MTLITHRQLILAVAVGGFLGVTTVIVLAHIFGQRGPTILEALCGAWVTILLFCSTFMVKNAGLNRSRTTD